MDAILDQVVTEIILWRLQYLEVTHISDEEIEQMKYDYLRTSSRIIQHENINFESELELADYLFSVFCKAKDRASDESRRLHDELDSFLLGRKSNPEG